MIFDDDFSMMIFHHRKSILKIKDGGYENGIKKLVFDDDDVFS